MGGIIFFIVVILILAGAGAGSVLFAKNRTAGIFGAAACFAALFIFVLAMCVRSIGPSDVGIVTFGGHTQGADRAPGFTWVWPGQALTVWDASVIETSFAGSSKDPNGGCLQIRIYGQQQACIDVHIWWHDLRADADNQFVQYRTFARVQNAYFSRGALVAFFNNRFERFNPVALASSQTTSVGQKSTTTPPASGSTSGTQTATTGGLTVSDLTKQVAQDLRNAYSHTAVIVRVTTSSPQYSAEVESALSKVVTAQANYNVAVINTRTATQQAQAAKNANVGNQLTANYLIHECLIGTFAGQHVNSSTWNCDLFGGSGSNASVLVGGTRG